MSESRVIITADAGRAVSEFRRFREQAVGALDQVSAAGGMIGGVLGAVGASLSVVAFTGWIKGAIDATDAASDLSQRIGVSVEDLAGLELAFQMGGMEASALEGAMTKLSKQIVSGDDAFSKLSVSSKKLDGSFKSNKDLLYELADHFAGMEEGVEKVALAQEVFGKSGAAMLPLLNGGAEGLREMDAMARQLGLSLSEEAVEQAGSFNDTLDLLMLGTQGVARNVAAELLPTLSTLAGQFLKTSTQGDTLKNTAQFLATGLKTLYTVGVGIVEVFSTVGKTLGAAGAQLVALLQGDFKLASDIGRQWQADIGNSWGETARSIAAAWGAAGDASVEEMAAIVRHGSVVGKSAAEIAAETKKMNQEQQAQAKLLAELSGLTGTFAQEWEVLSAAFASGALDVDALTAAQAKLLAKQPAIKAANDAALAVAADEKKFRDAATAAVDRDVDAIVKQAEALELKIRTYGMLPDAITDVQIAELEASQQSLVLTDAGIADIQRRIDALKVLKAAQSNSQAQDVAAESAKKALADQLGLWTSIEATAHDTFISIFDSGKSAFDRLKDALKNGLYELLYQMTVKKWIINVSSQTSGQGVMGQIGSALSGTEGGGVGGMFSNASSLISMGKTIYSGFTGGIASTLGGWASTAGSMFGSTAVSSFGAGMSAAGGNTGMAAMYASASTSGNVAAGASAGMSAGTYAIPIAGWIAAGMAMSNSMYKQGWDTHNGTVKDPLQLGGGIRLFDNALRGLGLSNTAANIFSGQATFARLFGRKNPEVESQGIEGTISGTGFDGSNYANIVEKGGLFRSSKRYTQNVALNATQDAGFDTTIKAMIEAAKGFASMLGIEASVIEGYNKSIKIQLGADEAKNQEAITKIFGEVGDELSARLLPSLSSFTAAGETASATLQRLVTDYATIDEALTAIGTTFGAVGVSSLGAREKLLEANGGLDAFATNTAFFHQTFLSEAERNAPVLKAVVDQMAALGHASVDTRNEFKQLVLDLANSGALATEAGAAQYAALMRVQAGFAQVYPVIDAVTDAVTDVVHEADEKLAGVNKGYQDQIDQILRGQMSPTDRRTFDTKGMDQSTVDLYDWLEALNQADVAIELSESKRSQEAAILEMLGDKTGALTIRRELELEAMDPLLVEREKYLHALEDEATALQTANSLLDIQAQIYELTGDKAAAAAVLAQQQASALAALDPALRGATQTLWGLQAAAKATSEAAQLISAGADALENGIDSAYANLRQAVERQKGALQDEINVRAKSIDKVRSLTNALRGALDVSASGLEMNDRRAAQAQIQAALAIAKASGVLPSADAISSALSALGQGLPDQYATQQEYLRGFYATRVGIEELAKLSDDALSLEERGLAAMEGQLSQFESMLQREQEQIDVLKGIDTNGLSITQALKALRLVMAASLQNPVVAASSAINKAYQDNLGRAPDAAGFEWWKNAAASGVPVTEIVSGIANSTEAELRRLYERLLGRAPDAAGLSFWMNAYGPTMDAAEESDFVKATQATDEYKKLRVPGFALGGDHGGGWRIVGEDGPELESTGPARIFNAGQTRNLMANLYSPASGNEAVAEEIRLLRRQVENLERAASRAATATEKTAASTERTATSNEQLADQFENVTDGGNAVRSEVINTVRVVG